MSEDWVYSADSDWMERSRAALEDRPTGSARHSGAGGFVPAVAAGWFPEESAQLWGCAAAEVEAPWLQQTEEEHLGGSQGKDRALRRVLTQAGCVVVGVEELCHPHWLGMTGTLWMSSHSYVPPHLDSSVKVSPLGRSVGS